MAVETPRLRLPVQQTYNLGKFIYKDIPVSIIFKDKQCLAMTSVLEWVVSCYVRHLTMTRVFLLWSASCFLWHSPSSTKVVSDNIRKLTTPVSVAEDYTGLWDTEWSLKRNVILIWAAQVLLNTSEWGFRQGTLSLSYLAPYSQNFQMDRPPG